MTGIVAGLDPFLFCWSMEEVLVLCGRNRREGTELDLVVLCCLHGEGVFLENAPRIWLLCSAGTGRGS